MCLMSHRLRRICRAFFFYPGSSKSNFMPDEQLSFTHNSRVFCGLIRSVYRCAVCNAVNTNNTHRCARVSSALAPILKVTPTKVTPMAVTPTTTQRALAGETVVVTTTEVRLAASTATVARDTRRTLGRTEVAGPRRSKRRTGELHASTRRNLG